ncbi:MAG: GDP-mannose 4,6-dehydratase [Planctomycetota bacterium]
MTRVALITGVTGQDGSYLADLLLAEGYEVHGMIRRSSSSNVERVEHLTGARDPRLHLHYGDMLDSNSLSGLLADVAPDEVYNLAAQSHVRVSFDVPIYTGDVIYLGTLRLLEALRRTARPPRLYQASTSEMFGGGEPGPLREGSRLEPRSPYAVAKVAAFHQTRNYREAYGLFVSNGILFNHESPRRGRAFVTRKITHGLAAILAGREQVLTLGNLDARRDWGFAGDYVRAMWLMLQHERPDDFVVATGEARSVREFLERCCALVGLDPEAVVRIDPGLFRPTEAPFLAGDASKAREVLGWEPQVSFDDLAAMMLAHDLRALGVDPAGYPALMAALPAVAG